MKRAFTPSPPLSKRQQEHILDFLRDLPLPTPLVLPRALNKQRAESLLQEASSKMAEINQLKLEQCRIYQANFKVLMDCMAYYQLANRNKQQVILLDGSWDHLQKMMEECKSEGENLKEQFDKGAHLVAHLQDLINGLPGDDYQAGGNHGPN